MAIDCWMGTTAEKYTELTGEGRWKHTEDSLAYANRSHDEAQKLLTPLAQVLGEGLKIEGGRSALKQPEELSGLHCTGY